jgi:hypothetical protein
MPRTFSPRLSRRDWLRLSAAGVMAGSMSGWLESLAADLAANPKRKRACILLWMAGGPSQMDTFDLKPGHANGGPYKEIRTTAPDLRISEHLPRIARFGDRLAVVRSMSTKEGEHERATFLMRTGYQPIGPIQYPSLGSLVAKELGEEDAPLPNFVSIGPARFFSAASYGPGFLGPRYAPLIVGEGNFFFQGQDRSYEQALKVQDIDLPNGVDRGHADARIDLLQQMESDFIADHGGIAPLSHKAAYDRAVKLMRTEANKAFNLDEESPMLRDAYGRNLFGQGCLLGRRLIERGVPFVEVSLFGVRDNNAFFGWDSHQRNFETVAKLSEILDPAWGTLMEDLQQRGLLDSTLIVWMGEFGRTPRINRGQGRDHFPNAWSTVLAGGGVKGGQAFGKTSADGMKVETRPISVSDFLATICLALGIDPLKQNNSNVGRPIRIADKNAQPIKEILA